MKVNKTNHGGNNASPLYRDKSLPVLNYSAFYDSFKHIGGWSECKLALLIALPCPPGVQVPPPHICLWIIFLSTKLQMFESNNTKTAILTTTLNHGEPLGLKCNISNFREINKFDVVIHHSLLKVICSRIHVFGFLERLKSYKKIPRSMVKISSRNEENRSN